MKPKSNLWHLSCLINLTFGGSPREPLCSRVYRMPPSAFRRVYLIQMDRWFNEPAHCLRVHAQWVLDHHHLLLKGI